MLLLQNLIVFVYLTICWQEAVQSLRLTYSSRVKQLSKRSKYIKQVKNSIEKKMEMGIL